MSNRVLIIGAGASGMMAAIAAASKGASVTILEQKEQAGKKLLVTGNGRCNITNKNMSADFYRSHDIDFAERFLNRFSPEKLIGIFSTLGLRMMDKDGYMYPSSQQASSVLYVLTAALKSFHVKLITGVYCESVKRDSNGTFVVSAGNTLYRGDRLILSAGSEASVTDPRKFTVVNMIREFGHHVYPVYPSLTFLTGNTGAEKEWQGVRIQGRISIPGDCAYGELQFTKDGISGIPVFQVSHKAVEYLRREKVMMAELDLLPELSTEEISEELNRAQAIFGNTKIEDFLRGWTNRKLIGVVLHESRIPGSISLSELSEKQISALADAFKKYPYKVTGYGSLQTAQTVQGGTDLREVTDSMESKKVPGLFITGELLDADGLCGGYNLHFAFGTGYLAGLKAAEEIHDRK